MVEAYKPLYTVREVTKVLKVNANTVYDLVNSGQLPGLRLGTIKIRGKDLEEFINRYPVQVNSGEAAGHERPETPEEVGASV